MELSAKYAYQVYKERSFSAAAKTLYVSQPALSCTIAKLEKKMGIRIFNRSKFPLTLTPQGRIYIQTLEEIIESESNMHQKIRELSDMSYGKLTIGGSSYASYYLMSEICGNFYRKYPEIKVTLDIGNIGNNDILWEKLKNDEIDLLLTYLDNHQKYIIEPIYNERIIIAMHKDMKGANNLSHLALTHKQILTGDYPKELELEDLSIFKDINFIEYGNKSDVKQRMRKMLGDYKIAPYTIENSKHSEMHYNLMSSGIGAVVTSDSALVQKQFNAENILFFVPKCKESYRSLYIARKYSTDDNPIIKNFTKIAKEFYKPQNNHYYNR